MAKTLTNNDANKPPSNGKQQKPEPSEEKAKKELIDYLFEGIVTFDGHYNEKSAKDIEKEQTNERVIASMATATSDTLKNIEKCNILWKKHEAASCSNLVSSLFSYFSIQKQYIYVNLPILLANLIEFLLKTDNLDDFSFEIVTHRKFIFSTYENLLDLDQALISFLKEVYERNLITKKNPMYKYMLYTLFDLLVEALKDITLSNAIRKAALEFFNTNLLVFSELFKIPEKNNAFLEGIIKILEDQISDIEKTIFNCLKLFINKFYPNIEPKILDFYRIVKERINKGIRAYDTQNKESFQVKDMNYCFMFWTKLAKIEYMLKNNTETNIVSKNYILGSYNVIMELIFELLKKNEPKPSIDEPYILEDIMPEAIAMDCMMEMFYLIPTEIFIFIYNKLSSYPSENANEFYACTLMLSYFVHKTNDERFKQFFFEKLNILLQNSSILNGSIRYAIVFTISKIIGFYPELLMTDIDLVRTIFDLIKKQLDSHSKHFVRLALYLYSILLSSSPIDSLNATRENFMIFATEEISKQDRKEDDCCRYVFDCLISIFHRSPVNQQYYIWSEALKMQECTQYLCTALTFFGLVKPTDELLDQTVKFLIEDSKKYAFEESFCALVQMFRWISPEQAKNYVPQCLDSIQSAIESKDKNTIEAFELLLGFLAVNYQEMFKIHSKEIVSSLKANLNDDTMLLQLYVATAAALCDIAQASFEFIKQDSKEIAKRLLELCQQYTEEPIIDATFTLLRTILENNYEIGKIIFRDIFKVIKLIHKGNKYTDQIAQSIINVILILNSHYSREISFLVMNESVEWITRKAHNSPDNLVAMVANELLQML
ncbi:hypothetical protein TVAG_256280 [Trichomonas vaginalis G3]|uniref:Uncharacterized protein n=1 Tax=Trichomonas vaginalis (strain ATCC PRA-98 / G3) TaxID=412133 RepID=A2FV02_TRIV3|nr:armadillo (ARM) repeat-containing protein family [Trichomonas vaginalis G3]EAX91264.1 hypothetical protein TVAG_256280 [Trichomonas vaginalis G3]KAI5491811.1 armadillo (ARM) repeat-containing protein family [Trichomonas vaginalis G3]|eukprot:XP_001304194.1 hypothetical protein [Trichomonas vaginalis G3]